MHALIRFKQIQQDTPQAHLSIGQHSVQMLNGPNQVRCVFMSRPASSSISPAVSCKLIGSMLKFAMFKSVILASLHQSIRRLRRHLNKQFHHFAPQNIPSSSSKLWDRAMTLSGLLVSSIDCTQTMYFYSHNMSSLNHLVSMDKQIQTLEIVGYLPCYQRLFAFKIDFQISP